MTSGGGSANAAEPKKCYQIVILGGGGVGKSCLTFRMVYNQFLERYDPTIEDSYRKDNFKVDDVVCPIEIMDTAGQDTFASMRDLYYKNGHGFLLVYSITDLSSLEDVKDRYHSLLNSRGVDAFNCPPVTVVGNKCDLEDQRVVSKETGQEVAREMGPSAAYLETSAKADINVEHVFQDIVRRIKLQEMQNPSSKAKAPKGKGKKCNLL